MQTCDYFKLVPLFLYFFGVDRAGKKIVGRTDKVLSQILQIYVYEKIKNAIQGSKAKGR